MNYSQAIDGWKEQNRAFVERVLRATEGIDEAALNRKPESGAWSPAQVIEHLTLGNRPYLEMIERGLSKAGRASDTTTIRYSFFGRLIATQSGPGGKAPPPKAMIPRNTPISRDIISSWNEQQARLDSLLERARGKDLSRTGVRNPFFRLIPMSLADCFEILTVHTKGHVQQIEGRLVGLTNNHRTIASCLDDN